MITHLLTLIALAVIAAYLLHLIGFAFMERETDPFPQWTLFGYRRVDDSFAWRLSFSAPFPGEEPARWNAARIAFPDARVFMLFSPFGALGLGLYDREASA